MRAPSVSCDVFSGSVLCIVLKHATLILFLLANWHFVKFIRAHGLYFSMAGFFFFFVLFIIGEKYWLAVGVSPSLVSIDFLLTLFFFSLISCRLLFLSPLFRSFSYIHIFSLFYPFLSSLSVLILWYMLPVYSFFSSALHPVSFHIRYLCFHNITFSLITFSTFSLIFSLTFFFSCVCVCL